MPVVQLGNPNPIGVEGKSVTTANIPDVYTMSERLRTLFHDDGLWPQHSLASAPDWVECDDDATAEAISESTGCPIGCPEDWREAS